MESKIKFLSQNIINCISAGEIIDRPSSVIKELLENAIDANASNINVIIRQSGKNSIIVVDDGSGMSQSDLLIAAKRHTTSKLDETDLSNINTFGFRGEALSSIGAISRMSITSRLNGEDRAYQISINAGVIDDTKLVTHNVGTKIEVNDLFFTTPGRLKFLRSDRSEFLSSVEIVKKIAIAHPKINISLTHNDRDIFHFLSYENNEKFVIKERIGYVFGRLFIENAIEIENQEEGMSLYALIGLPTFNKSTTEFQLFFVNNRPVKDKLLYNALRLAYYDYLPKDRYPAVVLFLTIVPHLVDVNVHPTKTEVRFYNPNIIKHLVLGSITRALSKNSHLVSSSVADYALSILERNVSNQEINNSLENRTFNKNLDYSNTLFKRNVINSDVVLSEPLNIELVDIDLQTTEFNTIAKRQKCFGVAKTQVHNTYIISQTNDGIIIIDQHAAHERLVSEQIKNVLNYQPILKQKLLIPEIIDLCDENRVNLLLKIKKDLNRLGLVISSLNDTSIVVLEMPSFLFKVDIKKLILDLTDSLLDIGEPMPLIDLIKNVTNLYSCHFSTRGGDVLSIAEMNALLRQMESSPCSAQCVHGRPTYVEIKLDDIERLFNRK